MEAVVLAVTWGSNFLSTLSRRPLRSLWALFVLVLAVLFAYIPAGTTPMDTAVYQRYYENPQLIAPTFEKGYVLFQHCIYSLGFSYDTYRLIIALIGLFSYSFMLHRLKIEQGWFWLLYPIVPYLEDVIQLRNFLMVSFMAIAASLLAPKRHLFFSILFILIGISFQSSGIIYIFGLAFFCIWEKVRVRNTALIVLGTSFALMLVSPLRALVSSLLASSLLTKLFGSLAYKAATYFGRNALNRIVFTDFLFTVINLTIVIMLTKYLLKFGIFDDADSLRVRIIGSFMATSAVVLPLLPLAYNFDRITKNSFIFFAAFMALALNKLKRTRYRLYWELMIVTVLYFFIYFVCYYLLASNDRYILEVVPILTQNQLFRG